MKAKFIIRQAVCYLLGLLLIALGINFSKMSAMGISAVSSVPRACELIWGFTLGTTTIIVYCVLVLLQVVVLRKKFRWINLLGVAVAVVFGKMIDLVGIDPNAFGHLLLNFPQPEIYPVRLLYTLAAMLMIAAGVFLYLRPQWIPMPAEGLASAIATVSGKPFGDCKTLVDSSMIALALILQLVFLGGLRSFTENVVVREGTLLLAVLVGQVVKLISRRFAAPLNRFLGKEE